MINKKIIFKRKSDGKIKFVGENFETQQQLNKWVEKMSDPDKGRKYDGKLLASLDDHDIEVIDTTPEIEKENQRKQKVVAARSAMKDFYKTKNPNAKQTHEALKEVIYFLRSLEIESDG